MSEARVIKVDPSLPCYAGEGDIHCGRPARAAWAELIGSGEYEGQWVLTPICEDCSQNASALYVSERVAEFYANEIDP